MKSFLCLCILLSFVSCSLSFARNLSTSKSIYKDNVPCYSFLRCSVIVSDTTPSELRALTFKKYALAILKIKTDSLKLSNMNLSTLSSMVGISVSEINSDYENIFLPLVPEFDAADTTTMVFDETSFQKFVQSVKNFQDSLNVPKNYNAINDTLSSSIFSLRNAEAGPCVDQFNACLRYCAQLWIQFGPIGVFGGFPLCGFWYCYDNLRKCVRNLEN